MRKLLGLCVCVGVCLAMGLGSTGCTKKPEKDKPAVVAKDKATVTDKAEVKDKATVTDKAEVKDKATVTDKVEVKDKATITDKAEVKDKVEVKDKGSVATDKAKVPATDKGAAAKDKTHEGTVVSAKGTKLVMKAKGEDKEHEHNVGATVKVTVDGKDAKLDDLKAGQRIRVATAADGAVTRVEGLDKNKDF